MKLSNSVERLGADVDMVRRHRQDERIGKRFYSRYWLWRKLFPKDVQALVNWL